MIDTLSELGIAVAAEQKRKLFTSIPVNPGPISFNFSRVSTLIISTEDHLQAEVRVQRTQPGGFRTLPQFLLSRHNRPEGQVVGIGWQSEQGSKLLFAVLGLPSRNAPFATASIDLGEVKGERSYLIPQNIWKPQDLRGDIIAEALLASINKGNTNEWWMYVMRNSIRLPIETLTKLDSVLRFSNRD